MRGRLDGSRFVSADATGPSDQVRFSVFRRAQIVGPTTDAGRLKSEVNTVDISFAAVMMTCASTTSDMLTLARWVPTSCAGGCERADVALPTSRSSAKACWEIETLKPVTDKEWVFVADAEHFERQSNADTTPASSAFRPRLKRALGGQRVLLYGATPDAMSSFVEDLRSAIS